MADDMKNHLTHQKLLEVLNYEPQSGRFSWKVKKNRKFASFKVGQEAGCLCPQGYRKIKVDGRIYSGARLAWFYMTGTWPEAHMEIDHINCVRSDNRWENLRQATSQQNKANRAAYATNKCGLKGVRQRSNGKWEASIWANNKSNYLGTFDDAQAAHDAHAQAAADARGEYARS